MFYDENQTNKYTHNQIMLFIFKLRSFMLHVYFLTPFVLIAEIYIWKSNRVILNLMSMLMMLTCPFYPLNIFVEQENACFRIGSKILSLKV